jgi:hypothetical protein
MGGEYLGERKGSLVLHMTSISNFQSSNKKWMSSDQTNIIVNEIE